MKNNTYVPDVLGNGFEQLTIQLKPDREGEVYCTLVRTVKQQQYNRNVLYIHGFSDYFFQKELAEKFEGHSYNFYALDLRKCGRSIRNWQTPFNLYKISDYFEDIDAAISQIRKESDAPLVLLGHSTGGLALSLYVHNRPEENFAALVLNSPFLDMNMKKSVKRFGVPFASMLGRFFPDFKIKKGLSPNYGNSISGKMYGEWEYNEEWKPIAVSKVNSSWIRAIHKAHVMLHKGLDIKCPILVMRSQKSYKNKQWNDEFKKADAVLNVSDIEKYAWYLGKNVTSISFKNALHDLILSSPEVREEIYSSMFAWLSKTVD